MNIRKTYGFVDVMKLIMAVLVIIIHKPIFDVEKQGFLNYISGNLICGIAVPFFFIASGYFFFTKINRQRNDKKLLIRYEKRLFLLYFIWTIIYLPCIFVKYNTGHYNELSLKIILGQIYLTAEKFVLSTSFVHFWYVNTLMVSVALIYLIYKKLGKNAVMIICLSVTLLAYLLSAFKNSGGALTAMYGKIPALFSNVFEKGLLCTSVGFFISKTKLTDKKIIFATLSLITFSAMLIWGIYIYEREICLSDRILYVLTVLTSAFIFAFCIKWELPYSPIYGYMRKYSTIIYFSHLLMMSDLFAWIARNTGIRALVDNELPIFCITLIFAVCFSTAIIILSKKEKFKFLRYLY